MKDVKLIALDMDGTLLMSDHYTVPQLNIDAIRKAHAAGITVTICTGRMIEDANDFCTRLGLPCMLIAGDGVRAADGLLPEARVFYRKSFEAKDVHALLDYLLPTGLMINVFEDGMVSTRFGADREVYHLVKRGLIKDVYGEENVRAAADREVIKIFIVATESEEAEMQTVKEELVRRFPHLQVTSSGYLNIEVVPQGAGKGAALETMAQYLGIQRENVMAIGDAQNDLSMLEYAAHSVAMGNADEEIKRVCRYETEDNDACGVGQMIERVLKARGCDHGESCCHPLQRV